MAVFWEHGKEPSSSIKDHEFLNQLRNNQLFKKVLAPWSLLFLHAYAIHDSSEDPIHFHVLTHNPLYGFGRNLVCKVGVESCLGVIKTTTFRKLIIIHILRLHSFIVLQCLILTTTCFGQFWPSSGNTYKFFHWTVWHIHMWRLLWLKYIDTTIMLSIMPMINR
jgi:hypothetical protein